MEAGVEEVEREAAVEAERDAEMAVEGTTAETTTTITTTTTTARTRIGTLWRRSKYANLRCILQVVFIFLITTKSEACSMWRRACDVRTVLYGCTMCANHACVVTVREHD
jgi:hypothetical protein